MSNGAPIYATSGPPLPADFTNVADSVAKQYNLDPRLFQSLIQVESGGNPYASGSAGEIGLTQLLPSTAAQLGVNPYDPTQNLQGGAAYLSSLMSKYGGDVTSALSAYNSGSPNSSAGLEYAANVINKTGIACDPSNTECVNAALGIGYSPSASAATGATPIGSAVAQTVTGSGGWLDQISAWLKGSAPAVILILIAVLFGVFGTYKLAKS